MKTTSMRLLSATLGATAIVGASTVAANACDTGGHDGSRAFSSAQAFSHDSDSGSGESRGFHGVSHWGNHWSHRWGTDTVSFEQKQAAIVDRLTRVDERLSHWIDKAQAQAAENPDGEAAQRLADLQAHQADLESLIAAVQSSTDEGDLKAAFAGAIASATADHHQDDGSSAEPVT